MDTKERIEIVLQKGFLIDTKNGIVYGVRGRRIGKKTLSGYTEVRFVHNKKRLHILAHRLIFFIEHGYLPDCIDHINRIKDDNRIENLRDVTIQQNMFNLSLDKKGYYWNKTNKRWQASIRIYPNRIYLGCFKTEDEARQAYLDAKKIYHNIDATNKGMSDK